MQRFLGIILFFMILVGCKSDRPKFLIKEKDMTGLLIDLHLAESYLYTWSGDSLQKKSADFIAGIYEKYNTDSALFRESLEYYASHPQTLNQIYIDVDKQLKDMETQIREREEKKYRDIFVADSIKAAHVSDSLATLEHDSIRYNTFKHLLFWKDSDSAALKPKEWNWKKELGLPKRYFNYTDSLFLIDSASLQKDILNKDSIVNNKDSIGIKSDEIVKKDKLSTKKQTTQSRLSKPVFKKTSTARLRTE